MMETYDAYVAMISVTETETVAVMRMHPWTERLFPGDQQVYFESEIERDGQKLRIVTARQNEMGMTAGAVLSMKLIAHYHPRYLIMVGIAAGVAKQHIEAQEYGDVIVADLIWNYSAGKYVSSDMAEIKFGDVGFLPRPTVVKIRPEIEQCVREAAQSPQNQCHVYIGPMASGSAVIANSTILEKQIHTQFYHTAGLDMEAYAVMYTAENAPEPRPSAIVIKSVCDFANNEKSNKYQLFAAHTSCEFTKLLYEQFLPLDDIG